MARSFTNTSDYLIGAQSLETVHSGRNFTLLWSLYPNWAQTDGADHIIFDATFFSHIFFRIQKYSDNKLYAGFYSSAEYRVIVDSANYTLNQNDWNYFAYVRNVGSLYTYLYLNGSVIGSAYVSLTTDYYLNFNKVWGNHVSANTNLNGRLAECAAYSTVLSDEEIVAYHRGASPESIRPDSLDAYWPMHGRYSPEIDIVGGFDLTVTGATYADHPRVYYPVGPLNIGTPPAGASSYTATGAFTVGAALLDGEATFSPGTKTGTSTLTAGNTELSASATHTIPTYEGQASLNVPSSILDGDATFSAGTKTATSTLTVGNTELDGSATFSAGTKTATATLTVGNIEIEAEGTFSSGTRTATSTLTTSATTLAASGTVDNPTYTGESTLNVSATTLEGSAAFATVVRLGNATLEVGNATLDASSSFIPVRTGTSTLEIGNITLAASGIHLPLRTGTASLSISPVSLSGSGTFVAPIYTGAMGVTVGAATFLSTATFDNELRTATGTLVVGSTVLVGTATFFELNIILGPYTVESVGMFAAGARELEMFIAGAREVETFVAGAKALEIVK